jgi:hypothetical protein
MLAIVLTVLAAPVPAAPDKPRKDAGPDAIRQALEQTLTLEFAEQPLPIALAQLSEQAKLNIVLDRASLMQQGQDPNELHVSVRLKDVKLRTGLRSLLAQHNLGYASMGDALLVTTKDNAYQQQVRQHVNLEVDNQPLAAALKQLERATGTNLKLDPRTGNAAQTKVTLQLEDVPLETAVRLLADLAGLKPVRLDNVLFVTTEERADKLRPDATPSPAPASIAIDRPAAAPAAAPAVAPGVVPPPGGPAPAGGARPNQ